MDVFRKEEATDKLSLQGKRVRWVGAGDEGLDPSAGSLDIPFQPRRAKRRERAWVIPAEGFATSRGAQK